MRADVPTVPEPEPPNIAGTRYAPDVSSPVYLVESGSLPTGLVALPWTYSEDHGVVPETERRHRSGSTRPNR